MKKILFALAVLLTIGVIDASAQSNPPLSSKRIRLQGQAAPPTPNPPTGYYNIWVDSATGSLNITDSAGTDTPLGGADYSALTTGVVPQMGATALENSKLTATAGGASTGKGIWTLYDDTATDGVTSFVIKEGEADVNSGNYLLKFMSFGGSNRGGVVAGINQINFRADRYDDAQNNNFSLDASTGLSLIDTRAIKWANGSYYNTAHVGLMPSASGILQVTDGSTGFGALTASSVGAQTANAAQTNVTTISESMTLATGAATTDSTADLLPANSIILSVTWRITTSIADTDATTISFGDATIAARFGTGTTLTATTTGIGITHMSGASVLATTGPTQDSAAKLRITLSGGADSLPSAGVVRVTVTYLSLVPPTS